MQARGASATTRQPASHRAHEAIKELILMGEIAPLSQIDELDLRERLDLGRTPIREALQRLAYDGLVTIVPFRGAIVSGIDLSDIDRIIEVRIPLEILAARLAAERATVDAIEELREDLAQYNVTQLCERGDFVQLLRLDQAMHDGIAILSDNKFLVRDLQRLRDLTWRFHVLYYRRRRPTVDDSFNNYDRLLDALAAQDPDHMENMVREHFRDYQLGFPK